MANKNVQIAIDGHLIIPFGVPKWDIDKIKIGGVSTNKTYIESSVPCIHVNKNSDPALVFSDFDRISNSQPENSDDALEGMETIYQDLLLWCDNRSASEKRFLALYFQWVQEAITTPSYYGGYGQDVGAPYNNMEWCYSALMPIPQAHLYLADPLSDKYSFVPEKMVKLDFLFWTGKRLLAVEIDGSSHAGDPKHIQKDRWLQRAGVDVIHILNEELITFGTKVVSRLMPRELTRFWEGLAYSRSPWIPF